MRVLSVDPGHSTGIAVFDAKGEYEFSLHVSESAWNGGMFLTNLVALARPDVVLLEGIPHKQVDEKTAARFHDLKRRFELMGLPTWVILPGQWKGLTRGPEIPSQHAKDAARMATWWIGGQDWYGKV